MMESKRCELVLNAVFYWEPVEFFQKWCDMITLPIFQDEPSGVVLDLLYARNLFIGYTCKSSIAKSNMFVFDPTYAYFSVIVVPNHEIMIRQETYVSCDETEMSLQESASNTLTAVFIN